MKIDEYVRDPAPEPSLSASVAHILLTRSPLHARLAHPRLNPAWQPDESSQMDLGTIAHAILLEQDESRVVVIDAKDWRTNAAKDARDAARKAKKLPILKDDRAAVDAMVAEAKNAIRRAPEIRKAFEEGQPEQTLVWQDGESYCRARPDWMTDDHRLLIDYKTTGGTAEPDAWSRGPMISMGYATQAAFGLAGVKSLYEPRDCSFVFMVQETKPPYAVSFPGLGPAYEEFGDQCRRKALALWAHCMAANEWPAYPNRVVWMDPPGWALARLDIVSLASTAQSVEEL